MDISNYNIEQCDAVSVLNAIIDMHDHPQKIDAIQAAISPIAAAAAAYSEGKPQLAQAITAKGVTTAADASLATMAQNVGAIIQQQTIISGGDAYKQQLFSDADPTKAVLWDLYQVLAQMKTLYLSGESSYTGLLICEYDKSLDAVDLDKANAWVCSDMVDKTTPILSTDDTHHVWNDANDGKANRWICFLYINSEGGTFTITSSDAALSPLSIYVGGHIQTIEYQTNGKLTELVSGLTENDYVDNVIIKNYTQNWNNNVIIRGTKSRLSSAINGVNNIYAETEQTEINSAMGFSRVITSSDALYINISKLSNIYLNVYEAYVVACGNSCVEVNIPDLEYASYNGGKGGQGGIVHGGNNTKRISIPKLKSMNMTSFNVFRYAGGDLIDVIVGAMETNLSMKNWNPTNVLADADKTATLISNIRNHILARVSDRLGTTFLTFTVSINMYNAITAADANLEADFLAKGWYLAGA